MTEVATTSTPVKVEAKGKLVIEWRENTVEMVFTGDVKGKDLDIAIRLIPRRYKLWRNIQLTELKKKEK